MNADHAYPAAAGVLHVRKGGPPPDDTVRAEPTVLPTTLVRRVNALIREVQRPPLEGIGKPESRRHALSGYWA